MAAEIRALWQVRERATAGWPEGRLSGREGVNRREIRGGGARSVAPVAAVYDRRRACE